MNNWLDIIAVTSVLAFCAIYLGVYFFGKSKTGNACGKSDCGCSEKTKNLPSLKIDR